VLLLSFEASATSNISASYFCCSTPLFEGFS
jgi:hypothetical protein